MSSNLVKKNTQQQSGAKALGTTSGAEALGNTSEAKASGKTSMVNITLGWSMKSSTTQASWVENPRETAKPLGGGKRRLPKDEGNPNPEEFNDDGTLRSQSRRPHYSGYNPLVPDGHLVLQDTREQDDFGNEGGDWYGDFGCPGQYPDKKDVDAFYGYPSEEDEEDVDAWYGY